MPSGGRTALTKRYGLAQRWDKHVEEEREEDVDMAALLAASPKFEKAYDAYLDAFIDARQKLRGKVESNGGSNGEIDVQTGE